MKKIFNIEDYNQKLVVMHCKNYEEAVEFTQYLDLIGKRWCSKERYTPQNTQWDRYRQNTCYEFIGGTYCELSYFVRNGYKVLNFEDFEFIDSYEIGEEDIKTFNEFISVFKK